MARLPRFVVTGLPHHLVQHGHDGQPIVRDDEDRRTLLALLRDAAATHRVEVHAWVLFDDHLHLVATPREASALSRMFQGLGRRYVAAFNRRHGRSGTLWNGRFRCALLQPERWLVDAMRYVEQHPARAGQVDDAANYPWSSLAHHLGSRADPLVTDSPAFWALGNTPFEREAAYRRLLETTLPAATVAEITAATRRGWPLASADFIRGLSAAGDRPLQRRPRGRPPKPPLA
jgi:putative transposase